MATRVGGGAKARPTCPFGSTGIDPPGLLIDAAVIDASVGPSDEGGIGVMKASRLRE